ncbi:hypothetical protein VNO77_24313 [Canavalia gladiata]|uniref:Uncharacterized protein n=1 Tax=Canavalia gladiata TaxID=3824 RepID=A0AAN9L8K0_CANGL
MVMRLVFVATGRDIGLVGKKVFCCINWTPSVSDIITAYLHFWEAPKKTLLLRNGMRAIAKYDCDLLSPSIETMHPISFCDKSLYFVKGDIDSSSDFLDNDWIELCSILRDAHGHALAVLLDF